MDFVATTQYADLLGSSAADFMSSKIITYLSNQPKPIILRPTDIIVGVEFYFDQQPMPSDFGHMDIFLVDITGATDAQFVIDNHDPIPVKQLSFMISPKDFMFLFPRINIILTKKALGIGQRNYVVV